MAQNKSQKCRMAGEEEEEGKEIHKSAHPKFTLSNRISNEKSFFSKIDHNKSFSGGATFSINSHILNKFLPFYICIQDVMYIVVY